MDFAITDPSRLKAVYFCAVYIVLVPRLVLFPSIFDERYLRAAAELCALYSVNYFLLKNCFIVERAPTLYEAFYGPLVSVCFALLNCKMQKDNPEYLKSERRRRW